MATGTFVPDKPAKKQKGFVPDLVQPNPQTLPSHFEPSRGTPVRAANVLGDLIHATGSTPVGQTIGKAFDLLSRPGMAMSATAARHDLGAGVNAFLHSETPQQYDADLETLTGRATSNVPLLKHVPHGLMKFAESMVFDPTTYAGGGGLLKKTATRVAERALPAAVRASAAIVDNGARLHPRIGEAARSLTDSFAKAHDTFVPGGQLKRELAATKTPAEGARLFAHAYAERNVAHRTANEISGAAHAQLDKVLEGLSPNQEHKLYVAINSGALYRLPKALRDRAVQFRQITDSLAYLLGNKQLRAQISAQALKKTPFQLPDWARPFDTTVRGLMKPSQYRQAYLPLTHDARTAFVPSELQQDLTRRLGQRTTARTMSERSPNLLARSDEGLSLRDASMQRDVVKRALSSEARAAAAIDAKRNLAKAFGVRSPDSLPTDVTHFLEQESKWDLGGAVKALRSAVDLPKQGMFYLPFRHMTNIGVLASLHYPHVLPAAVATYAKLLKTPTQARDILSLSRAAGVTQMHSVDRNLAFARALEKVPVAGKAAAAPYRASNKVLWAWDDAVKDAAVKSAVKRYMREGHAKNDAIALAGKEVNDRLIDYSTRSDFTKLAGYVAPFATWRTKLPGSIARAVAEHPERILAAQRANPALTGGQVDAPTSGSGAFTKIGSMNPVSDTAELVQHPMRYLRSSLSYPYQAALALGENGIAQAKGQNRQSPYFTYGTNPLQWLPYGALRSFPGMDELMQRLPLGKDKTGKQKHLSPFAPQDPSSVQNFLLDLLGGQTGIYLQRPRKT